MTTKLPKLGDRVRVWRRYLDRCEDGTVVEIKGNWSSVYWVRFEDDTEADYVFDYTKGKLVCSSYLEW